MARRPVERFCYRCGAEFVGRAVTCSKACAADRRRWLRAIREMGRKNRAAYEELLDGGKT